MKKLCILVVMLACLSNCATTGGSVGNSLLSGAEHAVRVASWLKPIADSVMSGICNGDRESKAYSYYLTGSRAAGVMIDVTNLLISKYKADPTDSTAAELANAVEDLKDKTRTLDAGYQGRFDG